MLIYHNHITKTGGSYLNSILEQQYSTTNLFNHYYNSELGSFDFPADYHLDIDMKFLSCNKLFTTGHAQLWNFKKRDHCMIAKKIIESVDIIISVLRKPSKRLLSSLSFKYDNNTLTLEQVRIAFEMVLNKQEPSLIYNVTGLTTEQYFNDFMLGNYIFWDRARNQCHANNCKFIMLPNELVTVGVNALTRQLNFKANQKVKPKKNNSTYAFQKDLGIAESTLLVFENIINKYYCKYDNILYSRTQSNGWATIKELNSIMKAHQSSNTIP